MPKEKAAEEAMYYLKKVGMTMIIVTHEMKFAKDISTNVVYMANGYVIEQGTPEQVFAHPQTRQLKEFLNSYISG